MVRSAIPWYRRLWKIRMTLVLVLTPLVFIPLPALAPSRATKCAYGILIMAVYWMTEVIPMAVTALLPLVIFPWLGVLDTKKACQNYFKDANVLFFGGLMVAVAVEKWNLHKRIALRVLMLVGTQPRWLMFGFMSTTAFLSMWISNTATTAMMIPISQAVLNELENHHSKNKSHLSYLNRAFEAEKEDPLNHENHENSTPAVATTTTTTATTTTSTTMERSNYSEGGGPQNIERTNFLSSRPRSSEATSGCGASGKPGMKFPGDEVNVEENIGKDSVGVRVSKEEEAKEEKEEGEEEEDWFERAGKGMRLCIAYAANIGGTATLTGTGPNLVLKGQLDVLYGHETGLNFSSWFVYAFPNMIISLFLAWLWLMFLFLGSKEILKFFRKNDKKKVDTSGDVVRKEYEKLGRISFAEIEVLILFVLLALLWLTRYPEFVPGWGSLLEPFGWVTDSCVAITVAVLLFMLPSRWPGYLRFGRRSMTDEGCEGEPSAPLLDWPTVHKQIPWNVLILLGGGFAMAEASKESGLSEIIGQFFTTLGYLPNWGLVFILCILTAVFTEVTSNVATATIFLPILAEIATTLQINPLYLMLPTTISASFAFMLPVATPPNAIVFAFGKMKIMDMMKAGIVQNCISLLVLQVATNTWGHRYFGLDSFPAWASKVPLSTEALTTSHDSTSSSSPSSSSFHGNPPM